MNINIPQISTKSKIITDGYRIAIGDIMGNIVPYKNGLLKEEKPCLVAGFDYDTPWTRDTSINVLNCLAIISPEVAKNSFLSVCEISGEGKRVIASDSGQYWDVLIWTLGAYHYCVVNNDTEFLEDVFEITINTLKWYEENEFDVTLNLFRGPAVYGDGVAAYPDKYGSFENSGIAAWAKYHPNEKYPVGYGLPMHSLSTNCVYYKVYSILGEICVKTGRESEQFKIKAQKMKEAINKHFWNEERKTYDYLAYECDHQEGLGISFAILFGIADEERAKLVLKNTVVSEHGITCVWPSFERYLKLGEYGRHSGTIWPFIQGFFGQALLKSGFYKEFDKNLKQMSEKASRDAQFYEIYHCETGENYGGIQENHNYMTGEYYGIQKWDSMRRQTWSASAFVALIYYGVLGLEYKWDKLSIKPYLPEFCDEITVWDIPFRGERIKITVKRDDSLPKETEIDGITEKEIVLGCY